MTPKTEIFYKYFAIGTYLRNRREREIFYLFEIICLKYFTSIGINDLEMLDCLHECLVFVTLFFPRTLVDLISVIRKLIKRLHTIRFSLRLYVSDSHTSVCLVSRFRISVFRDWLGCKQQTA